MKASASPNGDSFRVKDDVAIPASKASSHSLFKRGNVEVVCVTLGNRNANRCGSLRLHASLQYLRAEEECAPMVGRIVFGGS